MTKGNKDDKSLQDNKRTKRRRVPYWDAKEVMDNDWKTDGLEPMGYYYEVTEDEE